MSLFDRTILALMIGPIKAAFSLSDVQIGLLLGIAFSVAYSLLSLPMARLADHGNRKLLIIGGVTLWCVCTMASGASASFSMLLVLRLGLAVGEAVLTPAAYSLIGDLFPLQHRSMAASIYSASAYVGMPIAYFGGGAMIHYIELNGLGAALESIPTWRIILLLAGLPGIVLVALYALTTREPQREGRSDGITAAPLKVVLAQLSHRRKLYPGLFMGSAIAGVAGNAVSNWFVELLKRDFEWDVGQAGWIVGLVTFVAGITGSLGAPLLTRRLRARGRDDAVVLVSIGCFLLALVCLGAGPIQPNPEFRLALMCAGMIGALGGSTNIMVSMQEVAPMQMRATFVAIFFLTIGIVGQSVGPIAVPLFERWFFAGDGHLGLSISLVCAATLCPGLLLLFWIRTAFAAEARAGFPAVSEG
ncbi:MAG: hypothetical protein APF78_05380 [Sphingomonadales bacterium BRH_c3]|nr:MAG: hypothetical protein APF78_05380 [Sphingomonadales bacterium BRH_c3]